MDSLENQLRRCTRSWLAWAGSAAVTAALFAGVASTSIVPQRVEQPKLPQLLLAAPAASTPHQVPLPAARQLTSAELAEAFKFDPTTAGEPLEIPLVPLDTRAFGGSFKFFDPDASGDFAVGGSGSRGLAVALDMQRRFEVQKPESINRIIIFERNQVDEIPVWLYGPQPRTPDRFDRTDWRVLVLYSVSEKGVPENLFVLDSTDPTLVPPVRAAIADWRFRPARKSGKPVKVWVQQPVTFTSENKSPFQL